MHIPFFIFFLFVFSSLAAKPDTVKYSYGYTVRRPLTVTYYDQSGKIIRKKRKEFFLLRGRMWYYDDSGKLASKGPMKFYKYHRRWKYYTASGDSIVRYHYGIEKKELRGYTKFYTYGMFAHEHRNEKFHVYYVPLAGCVVSSQLMVKAEVHNFFVRCCKRIRYGRAWKDEMD